MIFFQAEPPTLSVGDPAPPTAFQTSDGKPVSLKSYRGRVVVVEFTALKCAPCRTIEPKLEAAAEQNPDVVFLVVSTSPPEDNPQLLALRPRKAHTHFLVDPYNSDRSKMGVWQWGNFGTPTMYVVDRKGRLASLAMQNDIQDLRHMLDRISWAKSHSK